MSTASDAPASGAARAIRRTIIQQSKRANVGHIGSALSVADLIAVLYDQVMHVPDPKAHDRDRFILSKGHAALALYAALAQKGWIAASDLDTFCGDDSLLGVHPEHVLPGVELSTGSLGHGLSVGAGAALAARMQGAARRVFVLVSDAECNEGSIWEAVMFAAHHKLANLTAIVDLNGQQALGRTDDILSLSPMSARWRAFGWDVHDVDGHDTAALTKTLRDLDTLNGPPHVVIAHTVFGKGVSYMERKLEWHYLPMKDDDYAQAMKELGD